MPSLCLHACDLHWQPADFASFARDLRRLGLAGGAWASTARHEYVAGADFLKLVMFLGCSPLVALDPAKAQGQVVSVRLVGFDTPVLLASDPVPAVRCPLCRTPACLPEHATPELHYKCKQCGEQSALNCLDWRRGAGCGRFFLELGGIYPHEAIPSDRLLLELETLSGHKWSFFYVNTRLAEQDAVR